MRIEDRLNKATTAVELQIESVPVRPVGVVKGRHRRHRTVVATSATALLLTLLVGSAFLFTGPAGTPELTAPSEVVFPAAPASQLVDSNLDWEVVDATVVDLSEAFAWDGRFYALSTAPGKIEPDAYKQPGYHPPQAVYSTDDGRSWDTEPVPTDLWLADLDHHEGVIYAVGSAPGVADTSEDVVTVNAAVSTDGGKTWEKSVLPSKAIPPSDAGAVRYRAIGAKIAAGSRGVVVAVSSKVSMDYSAYVPQEYRGSGFYVSATAEGIVVHDFEILERLEMTCAEAWESADSGAQPEECRLLEDGTSEETQVFGVSWAELGLAEQPVTTFPELFVSSDGRTFEAVTSPFSGGELISMVATDDGFVGVEAVYSRRSPEIGIWYSPDGRVWERRSTPPGLTGVMSMEVIERRIVLVGYSNEAQLQGPVVFTSDDDAATWVAVDVASLIDGEAMKWISVTDLGSDAAALMLLPETSGGYGTALLTTDLASWSEVDLGAIVGEPRNIHIHSIVSGDDRVLLSIVTSDPDEYEARFVTLIGAER